MTRYLVAAANAIVRRFDVPVEQHPGKHIGCIRCSDYSRAFLDGVVQTLALQRPEAEHRRLLRLWETAVPAGYPEAES